MSIWRSFGVLLGTVLVGVVTYGCGRTCQPADLACREDRCAGEDRGACQVLAEDLSVGDSVPKDTRRAYAIAAKQCDTSRAARGRRESCALAGRLVAGGEVVLQPVDCSPSGPARHRLRACEGGQAAACLSIAAEPPDPRCPSSSPAETAVAWDLLAKGCATALETGRDEQICDVHARWMSTSGAPWTPQLAAWATKACNTLGLEGACLALVLHDPDRVESWHSVVDRFPKDCASPDADIVAACQVAQARLAVLQEIAEMEKQKREAAAEPERKRRQALELAEHEKQQEIRRQYEAWLKSPEARAGQAAILRDNYRRAQEYIAASKKGAPAAAPAATFNVNDIPVKPKQPYTCQKPRCVDMGTDGRCRRTEMFADTCYW